MKTFIHVIICLIRLFAFIPLVFMFLFFMPLMFLLGVKEPFYKWVKMNEGIVFNNDI